MSKLNGRRSNGLSGAGTGGPRTPAEKRRSAQNASKHKIFAGRILPDEEKDAFRLFTQFQKDLRPQSSLELEFIGDLVLNRLQARRIDKYLVHEVELARVPTILEDLERLDARYRSNLFAPTGPPAASTGTAVRGSLHPAHCVWSLNGLKAMIEKRGAQPDDDLIVLDRIYGGELTLIAADIVRLYKMLAIAQSDGEGAESAHPRASLQVEILERLDREIAAQRSRAEIEGARDQFEIGSNRAQFLPNAVLRRIDRYRSTNSRQCARQLELIDRVRDLREPEDAPGD